MCIRDRRWTGSKRARELLDHWAQARARFVKVFPKEYKRALGEMHARNLAAEATAKALAETRAAEVTPTTADAK